MYNSDIERQRESAIRWLQPGIRMNVTTGHFNTEKKWKAIHTQNDGTFNLIHLAL